MPRSSRTFPRSLSPLAIAASLAAGGAAHAQDEGPYYIGARQAFTHDSRVLRQAGDQGDTISSTGVFGGLNLHLGRQRVFLDGSANSNRYNTFDRLNNTSYSLSSGLDWETIEHLSGTVRYTVNQNLIDYGAVDLPTTNKDVQKTQQGLATVRFGILSNLGVDGGVQHRSVDFSAPEDPRDYKQDVVHAGVNWGTPSVLVFRLGGRVTKGDYPSAVISPFVPGDPNAIPPIPDILPTYGPDKTHRKDVDLSVTWTASGLSTVNGRLSATRETHTQPTIPRLSGLTGAVTWDYRPTGRLSFKTALTRDTDSEVLFAGLPTGTIPVRGDNNRIGTVLDLQANYEVTAKIQMKGGLRHRNNAVETVVRGGSSSTDTYTLGATYQATRTIGFACNAEHEVRSHGYSVNVTTCSGQITLR